MNTNEQLAAAIVRANERLDWIEARDGKLPDDNYATIETTVGLVRALRGATAADTVTVDRASLTAHNLEKWEQIDQLQRAAAASEQRAAALESRLTEIRDSIGAYRYWRTNDDVMMYSCRFCPSSRPAVGVDGPHPHHRICVLNPDYDAGMQAARERLERLAASRHVDVGNVCVWCDETWPCRASLAAAAPSAAPEGA